MKILGGAADAELVLLSRTLVYRTFLHLGSFKRNLIDGTYKIYWPQTGADFVAMLLLFKGF